MSAISISLIMPALNAQAFIKEALDSVARQSGGLAGVEVIVADGGSSDDTRQIATRYAFVRVLDGVDNGIYEGFNRGLAGAQGDIIGFLNADDLLAEGALNIVRENFGRPDSPDHISGGVTHGNPPETGPVQYHATPMSVPGLLFGIPAINGRFFHRKLMKDLNGFAPQAGLAADREFLLRVLKSDANGGNIARVLYHYRVHSGSTTIAGDSAARARVWRAELELADYLERQNIVNGRDRKWTGRTRALARLKQRLAANRIPANTAAYQDRSHLPSAWHQTVPALIAWRYWRGKLSGY
ncbi:MAG: glycosyltransferase [Alphaproteobacteria bacterium]|nr:glycosyltransferase [Alphaproteobacteria bacterium]